MDKSPSNMECPSITETYPLLSGPDIQGAYLQHKLNFLDSGQELEFGTLENTPFTLDELLNILSEPVITDQIRSPKHPNNTVEQVYSDGLTSQVFKLVKGGKEWNLKAKRSESLVKNSDGKTAFLNELERRRDFSRLKLQAPALTTNLQQTDKAFSTPSQGFEHLVNTRYASLQHGLILSDWIPGEPLQEFNSSIFQQLFSVLTEIELQGFMEWDLSPSNIVYDGQKVNLFDFGYCYPFDPRKHLNSSGLSQPMFHSAERFETRNLFGYLLNQEKQKSEHSLILLFELEKTVALQAYIYKLERLIAMQASEQVVHWLETIIAQWQSALKNPIELQTLYLGEAYRSHVLDVTDDISGQSCTPMTLTRIDKVTQIVTDHFEIVVQYEQHWNEQQSLYKDQNQLSKTNFSSQTAAHGLLMHDLNESKTAVLERLVSYKQKAMQFQLANHV